MAEPKKVETYRHRINCINCKTILDLDIPQGTTVKGYLAKGIQCHRCGCDPINVEV